MIKKISVTEQVVDYIKNNIQTHAWEVGQKIPSENELTKILGVSRSSVRFAIQQFIAVGALVSLHGKGTYVKSEDLSAFSNFTSTPKSVESEIMQMLQFRQILEPEAAYLAALNRTDENLECLTKATEEMLLHVGDDDKMADLDAKFHLEIARACGNMFIESSLIDTIRRSASNKNKAKEIFGYQNNGYQNAIYYHTILLKSIREQKPKLAKKIMKEHIQGNLNRISMIKKE
ncbi:FCD domain-containing protein [Acidaminococcus fermentans DSM 20731]|uniref:GntR domain protein n=1 Tax=Acidaminococcus fermentans (strain ATCC 25085 / DSM 20731 / CCUG 9996 / CIP 106432 / VR4) TaxID=591001 RepID=D2RK71_ACIFV|nr:FCD domain-containing protein [Acidaminococcus fermentans]ADB47473.1 GntR domain protein [Acidaminococcus fermentans DSM 20731]UEA71915.1 FCD domain-containing protein [Acidaminococcus fermentans DSM 20731]